MHPSHIADSYDFVKRALLSVKPAQKHFLVVPMFTEAPSAEQANDYQVLLAAPLAHAELRDAPGPGATKREIWLDKIENAAAHESAHLFLDPDIGIRMPLRMPKGIDSRRFVDVEEIIRLLARSKESLLLCFDQSLSRGAEKKDREEKLEYLQRKDTHAVYFTSHACSLAASQSKEVLSEWITGIAGIGVPAGRLQNLPSGARCRSK